MKDEFHPVNHRLTEPRGFEQLTVGEVYNSPSRTMTDAHFTAFQSLSGDNHPIHYDREYCQQHGHRDLLAHGLQVLCFSAAGAGAFPHLVGEVLIGFVELQVQFKSGVFPGDTLYPSLRITELQRQTNTGVVVMRSTIHNQDRKLVLEGMHKYLLRLQTG